MTIIDILQCIVGIILGIACIKNAQAIKGILKVIMNHKKIIEKYLKKEKTEGVHPVMLKIDNKDGSLTVIDEEHGNITIKNGTYTNEKGEPIEDKVLRRIADKISEGINEKN